MDQLIELIKNQSQSKDEKCRRRGVAIEITSPLEGRGILPNPDGRSKEAWHQE